MEENIQEQKVKKTYDRLAKKTLQDYLDAWICLGYDPSLEKEFGKNMIDLIKINYGIDKKDEQSD